MNDPFMFEQAQKWAEKLVSEGASNEDRIRFMYLQAFGQPPTDEQPVSPLRF